MDLTGIVTRLTLLAAFCGLLVSASHFLSHDAITRNRAAFAARKLLAVVSHHPYRIKKMTDKLYQLRGKDGKLAGFIFDVSTNKGYNGHIGLWVGADLNGRILGVRVKDEHETPGLGDKIELSVSPWILEFNGKSLAGNRDAWNVKKDGGEFDQFTGATITPRAVVHAVRDGLERFAKHKSQWITEAEHASERSGH